MNLKEWLIKMIANNKAIIDNHNSSKKDIDEAKYIITYLTNKYEI